MPIGPARPPHMVGIADANHRSNGFLTVGDDFFEPANFRVGAGYFGAVNDNSLGRYALLEGPAELVLRQGHQPPVKMIFLA